MPLVKLNYIVFAVGFYDGLGYDNPDSQDVIQRAFDEGLVAIQMEQLQGQIPILIKKLFWIENYPREPDTNIYIERPPIEEKLEQRELEIRQIWEYLRDCNGGSSPPQRFLASRGKNAGQVFVLKE